MIFEKVEKESKEIVFVYTTCMDMEEARAIGYSAIEEKLATSADYWMVNSIYPWNNVIREIGQCMLMLATTKILSDKLIKHIETEHSYNIPMIVRSDISMTTPPYFLWVENTLTGKGKYITETEEQTRKREEEGYHYDRLK
ncbi:MAG TPA: divalent cation tolerance protein CutA [Candidatus Paceibacterota bacterium]|jgi:periplasmic divalent cation tolerance protein|nr:divalent cation tolerance protein CutA [Candidatus Paceibacterota bacterium]